VSRAGARPKSGLILPPAELERQRVALARAVMGVARQSAMEAGLSVSRVERAIRFSRPALERMLYLNCRYGSAAFDTRTGKLQDPA